LLRTLGSHRVALGVAILAVMVASFLSILTYRALAIGGGQMFEGTMAPGAHEWWKLNRDNVEGEFCNRCHSRIVTEVAATRAAGSHPIATCEGCHGGRRQGRGHVAVASRCSDCHPTEAAELLNDAHASFIPDIGGRETSDAPSWSCKACHTKVEVKMEVTPIAPLHIILGP